MIEVMMISVLRTFIAVARVGTFAGAGDEIGLTQAAVSAQMQRLEAELGFCIFDRSRRKARLTPRGRRLVMQVQELLFLYDSLGTKNTRSDFSKPVTLGAIASAQCSMLPEALTLFCSQNPERKIRVIPGLSMDLVNLVDAGDLDMAIVLRPPFPTLSGIHWTALAHEPFKLVVPHYVKGHNVRDILSEYPFIRYDRSSFGGRLVESFLKKNSLLVNDICELDELEAILKLVCNGVGVALMPHVFSCEKWPAKVRSIDLGPLTFSRDIGLIHRPLSGLNEMAKKLATLIINNISYSEGSEPRRSII
ncbi:LysR family transcriptional regulator [Lelliottia amnigena]|uniref:LysR family transcriptional regulator n=1 Tax=Lelliottia amnigena TaxID=61646 RepID=UPI003016312C